MNPRPPPAQWVVQLLSTRKQLSQVKRPLFLGTKLSAHDIVRGTVQEGVKRGDIKHNFSGSHHDSDTESGGMVMETVDLTMLAKLNFIIFWKHLVDKSKKVYLLFGCHVKSGLFVPYFTLKLEYRSWSVTVVSTLITSMVTLFGRLP